MKSLHQLRYGSSKNAWMTQHLFTEWLESINGYFKSKSRKILLLVDNAPSHKWHTSLTLDNVLVHFIPPNMTAHIQPMDAGIIANFKSKYRGLYLNHLVEEFDRTGKFVKINLKEAIGFVLRAWDSVETRTIINC